MFFIVYTFYPEKQSFLFFLFFLFYAVQLVTDASKVRKDDFEQERKRSETFG